MSRIAPQLMLPKDCGWTFLFQSREALNEGKHSDAIETYRPLVLNAFSHYNTERHEIRAELISAIQAVKNLTDELAAP